MLRKFANSIANFLFVILGFGPDVVTVTGGTANNAGSTAAELITYMAAKMLEVAELTTINDQFGEKVPLPDNSSKTIRFTREEKFTVSSTPTQLSEGIPPDATGITISQTEATVEQYGFVCRLSDLAELTARHNIVERTLYVMGLHAAETYDQLICTVLQAATNVYRPNSRSADTDLIGTDYVAYTDLVANAAWLSDNGGRTFEGGDYVFLCCPQVYATLLRDPDWKASNQYAAADKIWRGEVGTLANFRIVKTNSPSFAATSSVISGDADKVYSSFVIARFAYQVVDLQNLRVYVVAPGGQTDPLQQSRKMGYKFAFKAVISNENWIREVRSAGQNSVTNA